MRDLPDWLTSTLAADASGGSGVMAVHVRPLRLGRTVALRATTVQIAEGDNLGIHAALRDGPRGGPLLVAAGSPEVARAVMGDIVATGLLRAGFRAVVTDGLIRDSREIAELELAVWCRGACPVASTKAGPGGYAEAVRCGGVEVRPGDAVIADDDGVVVWPADRVEGYLARAEARLRSDRDRLEALR